MRTTSDEKVETAKDNVKAAILGLTEVIVGEASGWDEYRADYKQVLRQTLKGLLDVKGEWDAFNS